MKIALCNRDSRTQLGGDSIQVSAYIKALEKLGHSATYVWDLDPDLRGYDEVWLFHINFGWSLRQWRKVKEAGLPYKVFAIFYPDLYSDITHDQMAEILYGARTVYCLSEAEVEELMSEIPDIHHIVTVNNGVDKEIFHPEGERVKSDLPYLLSVGRLEEAKGHTLAVKVAKALKLDVYVIGLKWDDKYKKQILSMYKNAKVLDEMDQKTLAKYYRGCEAYICGSMSERNSLVVLEAAACGAPIINSIYNRGSEWLSAPVVDPDKVDDVLCEITFLNCFSKSYVEEVSSWGEIIEEILKT